MKTNIKSSYLSDIFNTDSYYCLMNEIYNKIQYIKGRKDFDSIAFTGVSGAAVGFPLSLQFNIPLLCVRKEDSHSGYSVEGNASCRRYIIVDDLIESGATFRRIIDRVKVFQPRAICAGILLYNDHGNDRCRSYKGNKISVYRARTF